MATKPDQFFSGHQFAPCGETEEEGRPTYLLESASTTDGKRDWRQRVWEERTQGNLPGLE